MMQTFIEIEQANKIDTRRLITVPTFKDRLGVNALAIAVSTHPVCVALREMLYDRQYIDLDNSTLKEYLMLLVNNQLPEVNEYFPGSGPLTQFNIDRLIAGKSDIYKEDKIEEYKPSTPVITEDELANYTEAQEIKL